MWTLDQATVNLITLIAVVHMTVFLGMAISALLVRQLMRFGFQHSWGSDSKDMRINGF